MAKKGIAILLALVMILGSSVGSFAVSVDERLENYEVDYESQSTRLMKLKSSDLNEQLRILQDLKILRGTGNGLELDKGLTRVEGAVIYLRLLGGEKSSEEFGRENSNYKTGFTDIPEWAMYNINYLHDNNLVNGLDSETFGSIEPMTAEQFTTLVLRGLGYKDSEGDFEWNKSLEKAVELEILTEEEKTSILEDKSFTREEMTKIAYNSIFAKFKDESKLLISNSVYNSSNDGFVQMFYVTLNSEEVQEFNKAKNQEQYSVFPENPEKRRLLFDKIQNYFDTCNKYFKFYLDDEEIEMYITQINDVGNVKYSEDMDDYGRIIKTTMRVNTPVTGDVESENYHNWMVDGNKLRIDSDINYFGSFYHGLILEYMRTEVDNLIHSPERLSKRFDIGGHEDFEAEQGFIERHDRMSRRVFVYDGVKVTDSISIQRGGSIDYHMYIDLLK